jgi:hypothetical protein
MANPEHVKVVEQGAEAIQKWREANSEVWHLDLRRADLRRADLRGADLNEADLRQAALSEADLSKADLRDANLHEADLRWAVLSGADLSGADLRDADLRWADLSKANLHWADLGEADLRAATFNESIVAFSMFSNNIDLFLTKGLETVIHQGPSTIGIDTLYESRGKIPETFLRGCGVPDALIAFLPSLIGAQHAIQFYSCFISYSHKDEEFAKRLYSRMRDEHLRVWFAPEDRKGGHKLHDQIEEAIRVYEKLLLVLSENSMNSEWVKTEIYHARQREVEEKKQVLFPIRLVPFETIKEWQCFDADTGKDLAREIREYYIPDFCNWKDHDSFETGIKRLLDDLKAESEKT